MKPAAQENPLQQMRRELLEEHKRLQVAKELQQKKDSERRQLADQIDRLQEALDEERNEKNRLRSMASSLRARVNTVRSVCQTLEKQQTDFDHFTVMSKIAAAQRKPDLLAPQGLLTFSKMDGEVKLENRHGGRSVKRTAYCTDYGNTRILGIREADAKEATNHRVMEIVNARHAAGGAVSAAPPSTATGTADPAPAGQMKRSQSELSEYRGLSTYGYLGADSRIDLHKYHGRSSRRTRMYRDYEGKFIKMDPSDWPSTQGVIF